MPKRRFSVGAAAVATAVIIVGACSDEGEFVEAEEVDDLGALCASHADCVFVCAHSDHNATAPHCSRSCLEEPCPQGYYCTGRGLEGQICVMGWCESDGGCPAGYSCDTDDSICVHGDIPCASDIDCPAATACNQGSCVSRCHGDDDCKQGFHCSHEMDACMPCAYHSHCANGFACVRGQCGSVCLVEHDCRAGFQCTGMACEAVAAGGPGNVGDYCADDAECALFCLHDYCSQICDVPNEPGQCPEGFYCEQHSLVCQRQG